MSIPDNFDQIESMDETEIVERNAIDWPADMALNAPRVMIRYLKTREVIPPDAHAVSVIFTDANEFGFSFTLDTEPPFTWVQVTE